LYTRSGKKSGSKLSHRFRGNKKLIVSQYNYYVNEWDKPRLFLIDSIYELKHPSLSIDGRTLFFTSDHPYEGHIGGNDLYMIKQNAAGKWSKPINLGPEINTSMDEGFPFFHNSGRLYFASDGHGGQGGLDILFTVADEKGHFSKAHNPGKPINSNQDDFGITFDYGMNFGYFTSNRSGGLGLDDIYAVKIEQPELMVVGLVVNKETDRPIRGQVVKLYDENDTLLDSIKTKVDGIYRFPIEHFKNYTITATDSTIGKGVLEIFSDKKVVKSMRQDLFLEKEKPDTLKDETIAADTIKQLVAFPVNFDFNKDQILESQNPKLNRLVEILLADSAITVDISSYSDCRGPEAYNLDLSQRRAKSTKAYLIKNGVKPKQIISAKGKGETNPIIACDCSGGTTPCGEREHRINRRSEFELKKPL